MAASRRITAMALIKEGVSLAEYSTLQVGGKAEFFIEAQALQDIIEALEFASKKNLPIFVMSGGSNVLFSDDGFKGLVILNRIKGIDTEIQGDKAIVTAGAG